MNITKSTLKYFFDKGPQLVLLATLPSLLSALLFSPSASLHYLFKYKHVVYDTFAHLYEDMHILPFDIFYLGIVGLILYVFVLALMFGIVDRHMRIGEFTISFRRAKTRINYNILTAIQFALFVGVVFVLGDLLLTVLYYLWAVAFGSGGAWLAFSILSWLAVTFGLILLFSCIILWPPFMLHTGVRTREAFRMGWSNMSGKVFRTAFTIAVAVVPIQLVMIIVGAVTENTVARVILDGLSFAIVLPYYVILMYNLFYDATGTERMDLQKIDLWSRKTFKRIGKD